MVEVLEVNVDEEIGRYDFIPRFRAAEDKLRELLTSRPTNIDFVGPIGAGKTEWVRWLKRVGWGKIKAFHELPETPDDHKDVVIEGLKRSAQITLGEQYYPDVMSGKRGQSFQSALDIQMDYFRVRFAQLQVAVANGFSAFYDGSITAGDFVFCDILNAHFGYLSSEHRARFESDALRRLKELPSKDLIVCVRCSLDDSLNNIVGRSRKEEVGDRKVQSKKDLSPALVELVEQQCRIYKALPEFLERFKDNGYNAPPIVMVDASRVNPIEQNKHLIFVYETMARALELRKAD